MMTAVAYSLEFEAEMAMAHVPVLTDELLEVLELRPGSRVVDCTFGEGGHASAVAQRIGPSGLLMACDRDPLAQNYYEEWKHTVQAATRFYRADFADTLQQLRRAGQSATHVYMDLGVSSMQIDTEERGFSYSYDAPLDMRMDPDLELTAADILNDVGRGADHLGAPGVRGGAVRLTHSALHRASPRAGAVLPHERVG